MPNCIRKDDLRPFRRAPGPRPQGQRRARSRSRHVVGIAVTTIVLAVLSLTIASPAGARPASRAACADRLYAVNSYSDSVSVIDTNANEVIATVPVGKSPAWVILTPDNKQLYVANNAGASVSVIDVTTNTVVKTIPTAAGPIGIVFTPDGTKLVISFITGSIQIMTVATGEMTPPLTVGFDPEQIRITPDGKYVYAASTIQGIYKIDVEHATIAAMIPIKDPSGWFLPFPYNLLISPDGSRVYVANTFGGFIAVIDTRTDAVVKTFAAPGAVGLQLSRDHTRLYVTNFWSASVEEYSVFSGRRLRTSGATGIDLPSHLMASADGRYLYFGQSFDKKLLVFDARAWKPVTTLEVGIGPNSVLVCDSASPR